MRYHLTHVTMSVMRKTRNKCWWSCGEKGPLVHCWWECTLLQLLWKTVWRIITRLKSELPYGPAIPPLCIYPQGVKLSCQKDICTSRLLQHYLPYSRDGNNLSVHWWMSGSNKHVVYMAYYSILYNHKKRWKSCHLPQHEWTRGYHARWSKPDTEGQMLHVTTYMRNLKLSNS